MGKMKDIMCMLDAATGYDANFLWDRWFDMCDESDDPDFATFVYITLTRGW